MRNIKLQSQATQSVTYEEIVHEISTGQKVPEDREPMEAAQPSTHIQVHSLPLKCTWWKSHEPFKIATACRATLPAEV